MLSFVSRSDLVQCLIVICFIEIVHASTCPPLQPTSDNFTQIQKFNCKEHKTVSAVVQTSVVTWKICWGWKVLNCSERRYFYKTVNRVVEVNKEYKNIRQCINGYKNINGLCKAQCIQGCVNGDCVLPNNCTCHPGYQGQDCNSECLDTWYGKGCIKKCQCRNGAKCDKATGKCTCLAGWIGENCGIKCPDWSWGKGCINNASCDKNNTKSSSPIDGSCTCKKGYQGIDCNEPCKEGFYEQNCHLPCQCQNGASCNHVNGDCVCTPGWQGRHCSNPCPVGKYGKNCKSACQCGHSSCDHIDGICTCLPGYTGSKCENVCPSSTYGVNCAENCSCVLNNTLSCDHVNGLCNCSLNRNGKNCDNVCTDSCVKDCNCTKGQGICLRNTGECLCNPGYNGTLCELRCEDQTYGQDCRQRCECKNNATCSHVDGSCTCTSGWMGKTCRDECLSGTYGMNCAKDCPCSSKNGICDRVTGTCKCNDEYQGADCTQKCDNWTYGLDCNKTCSCLRNNTEKCHTMTGKCFCKVGWLPKICAIQQECNGTSYGRDCSNNCQCQHNANCDSRNGDCDCQPGYYGKFCQYECPVGSYGKDCSFKCQCTINEKCDSVNGNCDCKPGYIGNFCEKACDSGLYGQDCKEKCKCQNGAKCDNEDGGCLCTPGWRGTLCEQPCGNWTYGPGCTFPCSCFEENSQSCRNTDGSCICKPGYRDAGCYETCGMGMYGDGCLYKCNCDECHNVYGCRDMLSEESSVTKTTTAIVAAVGSAVVILIILTLSICYKRRQRGRTLRNNVIHSKASENTDKIQYEMEKPLSMYTELGRVSCSPRDTYQSLTVTSGADRNPNLDASKIYTDLDGVAIGTVSNAYEPLVKENTSSTTYEVATGSKKEDPYAYEIPSENQKTTNDSYAGRYSNLDAPKIYTDLDGVTVGTVNNAYESLVKKPTSFTAYEVGISSKKEDPYAYEIPSENQKATHDVYAGRDHMGRRIMDNMYQNLVKEPDDYEVRSAEIKKKSHDAYEVPPTNNKTTKKQHLKGYEVERVGKRKTERDVYEVPPFEDYDNPYE